MTVRRWIGEALTACALLIWRAASLPLFLLWRDWIAICSLYWLFTLAFRRAKSWPVVTTSIAAFLLGIYVFGQVPHAAGLFRPRP